MSLRIRVPVALLLVAAACTEATAVPPNGAAPELQALTGDIAAGRWRAMLVAGDNTITAFDNAVDSLRDKLAAQGVRRIGLYSSKPARVDQGHLARAVNLRNGLRGGQGGGQADACLAFMTSHGSENGFLLRLDNNLLSPSVLDRILAESCGAAPTVVIMSACHSGAFVDDRMRRPNRVILTAAALDRASFGCGAGEHYTYYDRCLLQQFDGATTWRELATATRACVAEQERRMGVRPPSLPQTFVGSEVADLRIPGR